MRLISVLLGSFVLLSVGLAGAEPPPDRRPFALRGEGYLGAAVIDSDGAGENSAFDAGGVGSAVGLLGPAFLQMDLFGDYADFDPDARTVGYGGHLGLVDAELGAVAVTGGYQEFELDLGAVELENDVFRVGGEAEGYLGPVTLGAQGGYLRNADSDDDGYYVRGLLRLYPTENVKLEGVAGVTELETDTWPQGRFLVEYRPGGSWISFFARWEGTFDINFFPDDPDQHNAVAGIRVYWDEGISLRESDRAYFRDGCTHVQFGARLC